MARYNELQVGRFARFVQKLTGIKGEVPVGSVAGELTFAHPIFHGPENRYLETWERFSFSHFFAAVAAQNQGWQMRNPRGSNVITVIEKLVISTGISQEMTCYRNGANPADLTTTTGPVTQDERGRSQSTTVCSFQTTTPGTGGFGAWWDHLILANTAVDLIWDENQEIVLVPGAAILIASNTVNSAMSVSALFRERFLEEPERS